MHSMHFECHLLRAAQELYAAGAIAMPLPAIPLARSKRSEQGDFTSAIALLPGERTGLEPRALAEALAAKLRDYPAFGAIEVAGPGFLNLTIAPQGWTEMLATLLAQADHYGGSRKGEGRSIEIGFVAVDEQTPLPVNYGRCAMVGDALANLLDFTGHRTSRSYRVNEKAAVTIQLGQPVRIRQRGRSAVSSSSLAGLAGLIDEDAVRFGMLIHPNGVPVLLDVPVLADLSHANPLFQVQYAHARCCAIRKSGELAFPDLGGETAFWDTGAFSDEGARLILRQLALYPRQIDHAAREGQPSWLVRYLQDLASELHAQYYRSLTAGHLRFIRDDDRLLTGARLALVHGVETVLKSGLALLGVHAPEEIR